MKKIISMLLILVFSLSTTVVFADVNSLSKEEVFHYGDKQVRVVVKLADGIHMTQEEFDQKYEEYYNEIKLNADEFDNLNDETRRVAIKVDEKKFNNLGEFSLRSNIDTEYTKIFRESVGRTLYGDKFNIEFIADLNFTAKILRDNATGEQWFTKAYSGGFGASSLSTGARLNDIHSIDLKISSDKKTVTQKVSYEMAKDIPIDIFTSTYYYSDYVKVDYEL